jgi:hypothetical protein
MKILYTPKEFAESSIVNDSYIMGEYQICGFGEGSNQLEEHIKQL